MSIKQYLLYDIISTTYGDYCRFYDKGCGDYKFIALLDTGELVYADSVSFINKPMYKDEPLCRYLGKGVLHDVLSYKGVFILSLMAPYKEELLNRKFCIIKYTKEGDRHYGKLLSVDQLKTEFNW